MASVALIGPGAIGGAFAGALLSVGHTLQIAARTPFSELRVRHPSGEINATVHCLATPADASPVPFVLLATKVHQTAEAASWLRALCDESTVLLVLQNGIEQRETVAPFVANGTAIVPAMVACPAHREGPGQIVVTGPARLDVPQGDGGQAAMRAFAGTYAEVRAVDDFHTSQWIKLVMNAASGGVGVLSRRDNRVLREDDVGEAFVAIAREVIHVARADGARIPEGLAERMLVNARGSLSAHTPSIVADRLQGAPTEWRARNEVVLRRAARYGIDVPLNRMVTALIRAGEPEGNR